MVERLAKLSNRLSLKQDISLKLDHKSLYLGMRMNSHEKTIKASHNCNPKELVVMLDCQNTEQQKIRAATNTVDKGFK